MAQISDLINKMKEIEIQDALSISQILKMDMYDYKKTLLERARKQLKNE